MSGGSSNGAGWSTRLEPVRPPDDFPRRADDPRLGEVMEFWQGDPAALRPGRAVIVGFPQDEGVRRNHGRPGAAEAPQEIRRWLYRLTPVHSDGDINLAEQPPLDVGNVRIEGDLEETQQALGEVVGGILRSGAVPVVLGGGHETAYGHYLGYVTAGLPVGILNLDAHLDLRPCIDGRGHSGSSFRQALEHSTSPLPGDRYTCLGVQPHATASEHLRYGMERYCGMIWYDSIKHDLYEGFREEVQLLADKGCHVYVTFDADAVRAADVPGVSAPNSLGFSGAGAIDCAFLAGELPSVASFDLVEINPRYDRDGQSARWAALAIWHFLIGRAARSRPRPA